MKTILSFLTAMLCVVTARAQYFSDAPDADAFVRSNSPTLNYGADASLSVSGLTATNSLGVMNGRFDTFMRFNTGGLVVSFNSVFGANNWNITHAFLQVTEQGVPSNPIFNQGVGQFQVRWVANTNWTEGIGTASLPTTTGICYNSETGMLNNNTDEFLGTFTNSGASQTEFYVLTMPPGLVNAIKAGKEVDLYLTATTPGIGFTFDSMNSASKPNWPFLEIAAEPPTGITGMTRSGKNLTLNCTNGAASETYFVLSSTNLTLPISQWLPVATNQLSASGQFSITVTNGVAGLSPKYFTVQEQ
jgi:hypothetical protein